MIFLDAVEHDGPRPIRNKHKLQLNEDEKPEIDIEFEGGIVIPDSARFVDTSHGPTTFLRQFTVLTMRDLAMAIRDPALYYMQFFLILTFGFLVGAAFYNTRYNVGDKVTNIPAGIVWIIFMMSYVQIFKVRSTRLASPFLVNFPYLASLCLALRFTAIRYVDLSSLPHLPLHRHGTVQIYHLSRGSALFKHERANNTVSVLAVFFADLTTTAIGLLTFIPGTAIAYFMAGFPNSTFPFIMLIFWVVSLVHLPCCLTLQVLSILPFSLFTKYSKQHLLSVTDCVNCREHRECSVTYLH
jgi:hypothetical protein